MRRCADYWYSLICSLGILWHPDIISDFDSNQAGNTRGAFITGETASVSGNGFYIIYDTNNFDLVRNTGEENSPIFSDGE